MADLPRLTSRMLVDALIRQVQAVGGFATILQRGNNEAGAILIDCQDRGIPTEILEKSTDFDGYVRWRRVDSPNAAPANWRRDYPQKRAASDPDSWWIELDIAGAARFADDLVAIN
jgi:hypothetical protein